MYGKSEGIEVEGPEGDTYMPIQSVLHFGTSN